MKDIIDNNMRYSYFDVEERSASGEMVDIPIQFMDYDEESKTKFLTYIKSLFERLSIIHERVKIL